MKLTAILRSPYLTLVAGLALAGVLLGMSGIATSNDASRTAIRASTSPVTTGPSAPDAAIPDPSGTRSEPAADPTVSAPAPATVVITYAGSVDGGAATIAIAVNGDGAIAYLCDGSRVEAWLRGSATGGQLALTGAGGASLTGSADGRWASGDVAAAGRHWTFRVGTVQKPSGLYRVAQTVADASIVGGWIVTGTRQVGIVTRNGVAEPAPPIDPASGRVTIDGTTVVATPVDGSPIN